MIYKNGDGIKNLKYKKLPSPENKLGVAECFVCDANRKLASPFDKAKKYTDFIY